MQLIEADTAIKLLAEKGYQAARTPMGFIIKDRDGNQVGRPLGVDINGMIVRKSIQHLLD